METLTAKYADAKPIGVYPMNNFGGLVILDLNDEQAVAAWNFGSGNRHIRRHKINTTTSGRSYIRKGNARYYFDEIMRCDP